MKYMIILLLCISISAQAAQITPLAQGEMAPYQGYLIDSDMEKKMRLANEKMKRLEIIRENQKQVIAIYKSKIDYYKQQAEEYKKQLEKEHSNKVITGILSFIGGVILTGGIGVGLLKLAK